MSNPNSSASRFAVRGWLLALDIALILLGVLAAWPLKIHVWAGVAVLGTLLALAILLAPAPPKRGVWEWFYALVTLFALIVLLMLCLILILRIWPGSRWVNSWYGRSSEVQASLAVCAKQNKILETTRGLLAKEANNASARTAWTETEIEAVNQGVSYAFELSPQLLHKNPESVSFGGQWHALSSDLKRASTLIDSAQTNLALRVRFLSMPVETPCIGDLLWDRLREEKQGSTPDHWGQDAAVLPAASEVTDFNNTLAEYRKGHPVALFNQIESHYLILILFFGMLGASLRSTSSLVLFFAHRKLEVRWVAYYMALPFSGAALALSFYAVLRGGFMSVSAPASDVTNLYSCVGLAVLVGIAAREAQEQILKIAEALFVKATGDGGSLKSPKIEKVERSPNGTLLVRGENLGDPDFVYLDGRTAKLLQSGASLIEIAWSSPGSPAAVSIHIETKHGTDRFQAEV